MSYVLGSLFLKKSSALSPCSANCTLIWSTRSLNSDIVLGACRFRVWKGRNGHGSNSGLTQYSLTVKKNSFKHHIELSTHVLDVGVGVCFPSKQSVDLVQCHDERSFSLFQEPNRFDGLNKVYGKGGCPSQVTMNGNPRPLPNQDYSTIISPT